MSRKAALITLLALSQRSGDPERAQRVEGSPSTRDYNAGMTDTLKPTTQQRRLFASPRGNNLQTPS